MKRNPNFETHARNETQCNRSLGYDKTMFKQFLLFAVLPKIRKQMSLICLLSILKISQTKHGLHFILVTCSSQIRSRLCELCVKCCSGSRVLSLRWSLVFHFVQGALSLHHSQRYWTHSFHLAYHRLTKLLSWPFKTITIKGWRWQPSGLLVCQVS
jgi:hypothetical protein